MHSIQYYVIKNHCDKLDLNIFFFCWIRYTVILVSSWNKCYGRNYISSQFEINYMLYSHLYLLSSVAVYIACYLLYIFKPPPRGCAGGRIGTRSSKRGQLRCIEMGPRASSAWMGVCRLCGMYKFTTNPSFGWDVNKNDVPCWEIATLFAR